MMRYFIEYCIKLYKKGMSILHIRKSIVFYESSDYYTSPARDIKRNAKSEHPTLPLSLSSGSLTLLFQPSNYLIKNLAHYVFAVSCMKRTLYAWRMTCAVISK